jgi:hypothetical protein
MLPGAFYAFFNATSRISNLMHKWKAQNIRSVDMLLNSLAHFHYLKKTRFVLFGLH